MGSPTNASFHGATEKTIVIPFFALYGADSSAALRRGGQNTKLRILDEEKKDVILMNKKTGKKYVVSEKLLIFAF